MQSRNSENYQELINNLKIGDLVNFPLQGALLNVKGEVRDFYFSNKHFYIVIYSFFKRKELTFILTRDLCLHFPHDESREEYLPENLPLENFHGSIEWEMEQLKDESPARTFFGDSKVKKILALAVIVALIYPLIEFFISPLHAFFSTAYSYEEFLGKEFPLQEIARVVSLRVHYRSDFYDEWHTPAYAWEKREGDCEEMAALCAAYLSHHQATCFLVGLKTAQSNTAHAVVFIKGDKLYYILDPTRAVEAAGFKALPSSINSLRQAVLQYAPLPASVFKIPAVNGEKKELETIN